MNVHIPQLSATPGWAARPKPFISGNRPPVPQVGATAVRSSVNADGSDILNVVITGGSKGLGFAMAQQFLAAGDKVVICGRDDSRLAAAVRHLQQHSVVRPNQIHGVVCDVSVASQVDQLAQAVRQKLGTVHRWLNNAGAVTQKKLLHQLEPEEIQQVVGVNVLGSLLCSRAAIQLMQQQHQEQQQQQQQQRVGASEEQQQQAVLYHIFNMGFSQWGASFSKSACTHKSTKMALTQLNISLAQELSEAGLSYIGVHNLSPGMVLTDLLLQGSSPVARRFFNVLAEEPDTVAAELVPQIRAVQGSGSSIDYLSPAAAISRVLTGVPQIIAGGRFFDKEGNRVSHGTAATAPAVYNSAGVRVLFDYPPEQY